MNIVIEGLKLLRAKTISTTLIEMQVTLANSAIYSDNRIMQICSISSKALDIIREIDDRLSQEENDSK